MSTAFDQSYEPPFPRLFVTLYTDDERIGPFSALIDTGADATIAPTKLLERINAWESGWATMRSHFGERQSVQLYLIGIEVEQHGLSGLYVIGDDVGEDIILGRDILNRLALLLDGPQHRSELVDDVTLRRLRSRRKTE